MWREITANVRRYAGASGTVSLPAGAQILSIVAHSPSGGTVTMPDGAGGTATIIVPAGEWWAYDPKHLCSPSSSGPYTISFVGTDSYVVEAVSSVGW
jgi:hypothetical protein